MLSKSIIDDDKNIMSNNYKDNFKNDDKGIIFEYDGNYTEEMSKEYEKKSNVLKDETREKLYQMIVELVSQGDEEINKTAKQIKEFLSENINICGDIENRLCLIGYNFETDKVDPLQSKFGITESTTSGRYNFHNDRQYKKLIYDKARVYCKNTKLSEELEKIYKMADKCKDEKFKEAIKQITNPKTLQDKIEISDQKLEEILKKDHEDHEINFDFTNNSFCLPNNNNEKVNEENNINVLNVETTQFNIEGKKRENKQEITKGTPFSIEGVKKTNEEQLKKLFNNYIKNGFTKDKNKKDFNEVCKDNQLFLCEEYIKPQYKHNALKCLLSKEYERENALHNYAIKMMDVRFSSKERGEVINSLNNAFSNEKSGINK